MPEGFEGSSLERLKGSLVQRYLSLLIVKFGTIYSHLLVRIH